MLERLRATARLQFLGVADRACGGEMLIAAAMIEVIVRVDHVIDVLRLQSERAQLAEHRLFGILQRLFERQHAHDVVIVVAGIEDIAAVLVLDEHRIAGKANFAGGAAVPEHVKAVDHKRSAIEQVDLRTSHDFAPI